MAIAQDDRQVTGTLTFASPAYQRWRGTFSGTVARGENRNHGPMSLSVNEWIELTTPDRVRNVPNRASENARRTRSEARVRRQRSIDALSQPRRPLSFQLRARTIPRRVNRREEAAMRKRYVASKRHTIQVDFDDYLANPEVVLA